MLGSKSRRVCQRLLGRRCVWICLGTLALLPLGSVIWLTHRTSQVLNQSVAQLQAASKVAFNLRILDPSSPGGRGALRVEPISSPSVFSDVVDSGGRLYLAGASGLSVYASDGSKLADYHPGIELPSAPIVALAGLSSFVPQQGAQGAKAGTERGEKQELAIATAGEGLLLWDGRVFTQVRPEDRAARDLTAVLPVSTGRLLLGTRTRGVLVWDGGQLGTLRPDFTGLKVTALAGDETDLWIGTLDQGVLHWHAGILERVSEAEGLPDPQVTSIDVHGDAAYVGTPMGVAEFGAGGMIRKLAEGSFARSLLATHGTLWVGTMDEGVLKVALDATVRPRPGALSWSSTPISGAVQKITETDGRLWALTDHALYTADLQTGGWQQALIAASGLLADDNISALAFDPSGRLWIGYFDRGLDIVEPGGARTRHLENGHLFCVNRVVPKPAGDLVAVGTANGLVLFNSFGGEQQVLGREQGLIADDVTDVLFRGDGMVVATPAGLTLMDHAGVRSLYAFEGLVNNHVYALAGAGDRILAGTLGGLSVLQGGLVQVNYTTANSGLRHNWINAVVGVDDGWFVGTYGAGVVRLGASGSWSSFPDLTSQDQVNPNAMLVTASHVYAGTLADGLLVYNRSSGRWTEVRDGLPSPNVTALAEHNGWIYAGTDNGLVRFSEGEVGTR